MSSVTPPPVRIGRYDLVERLAIGGMAHIFLALERGPRGLERYVVVKRILENLAQDEAFVEMFLHEARISAQISHPNVVQIHELGEEDGLPYLVMEYVPGVTLRDVWVAAVTKEDPVPVGVALHLILQAAAGAHAVHELRDPAGEPYGLIHRDLTPHNIMVTPSGYVKIVDFGIAKGRTSGDFTRTGMIKGKLAYLAPEQCRQEPFDRRADVFALAVDLWELLAGRRLFSRDTEVGTLRAILEHDVPDLRELRPLVPEEVVQVLEAALATEPDARTPTADAFRRGLRNAAREAGLEPSQDATASYLKRVVGDRFADVATRGRERTVTLSRVPTTSAPTGTGTTSTNASHAAAGLVGAAGALVVIAVVAAVAVGVGGGGLGLWWWTHREESAPPRPTGEPVVFALAPVRDADQQLEEWAPLQRWIELEIDRPVDLKVYPSYRATADALVDGYADVASLPPATYVRTHREIPDVTPIALHVVDGSNGYDGLILIRDDSTIATIEQLAGARFCFTDPDSTSGYLFAVLALERAGLDPEADLAEIRFSGSHDQAIRDLVEDRCDAAATYTDAWQTASERGIPAGRTRLLTTTGRAPHDAICAGPHTDPVVAADLREALLRFDPETDLGVEHLGATELISGFRAGDDAAYADVLAAIERSEP